MLCSLKLLFNSKRTEVDDCWADSPQHTMLLGGRAKTWISRKHPEMSFAFGNGFHVATLQRSPASMLNRMKLTFVCQQKLQFRSSMSCQKLGFRNLANF